MFLGNITHADTYLNMCVHTQKHTDTHREQSGIFALGHASLILSLVFAKKTMEKLEHVTFGPVYM